MGRLLEAGLNWAPPERTSQTLMCQLLEGQKQVTGFGSRFLTLPVTQLAQQGTAA